MGLQIWLPLTAGTQNIGLAREFTFSSSSSASLTDNGKIGSCYNFSGYTGAGLYSSDKGFTSKYINNHSFSLCAWVNSSVSNTPAMYIDYGVGISINSNGKAVFTLYSPTGTNSKAGTSNVNDGKWHHICGAYDCDEAKMYLYVDGILEGECDYTVAAKYSTTWTNGIYVGRNPNNSTAHHNYFFQGKLNDIRFYDECISAREAYEISKGLVVHYKMCDGDSESTVNLVNDNNVWTSWSSYGFGGKGKKATVVDTTCPFNPNVCKVTNKTTTAGICEMARWVTGTTQLNTGDKVSASAYVKGVGSTIGTTGRLHIYNRNASGDTLSTTVKTFTFTPEWQRVEGTYTWTKTNPSSKSYSLYIVGNNVGVSGDCFYFSNVQFEEKDHTTPFVNGSRDSSMVDCSGYLNNATPIGSFEVVSGSAHYTNCVKKPAGTYFSHKRSISNVDQQWTCCAWVKPTNNLDSYLNNFNSSNKLYDSTGGYPLLYLNSGTNDYYNYGNMVLPLNEWSHIAFVFDNSDGYRHIFINGEDHTRTTGPNKTSTPSGIQNTVYMLYNFAGYVCDYREYATKLSEDDIKNIYRRRLSVDNMNGMSADEFFETGSENRALFTNKAIMDGKSGDGLSSYQQAHCVVSLTDGAYRIYRDPNLTYPGDGSVMWGGLVLSNDNNRFGLQKNHSYVIQFSVSGQTTNLPEYVWSNKVGLSGGGLLPTPSNVSHNEPFSGNGHTDGWEEVYYKWTIPDDIYKVCTQSYSSFVSGTTYVSYNFFKYGFIYQNTGELGTDIYIKNLRLYDVTNSGSSAHVSINKNGEVDGNSIFEYNGVASLRNTGDIFCNKFNEV